MASLYFKNFAIENHLTVDYGYTFGWYKDFYISVKEGLSYKILTIITKLGEDKEKLKEVLSNFEKDLEKYCVTENKFEDNYLQFTFNLNNDRSHLVIEFMDRFIQYYTSKNLKVETFCPICHKVLDLKTQKVGTINKQGIITPVHENCFEKEKEKIERKVRENFDKVNAGKSTLKGIIGATIFGVILVLLMIGCYYLKEALLSEYTALGENRIEYAGSANLFHYLPSLLGFAAPFLIDAGYDLLKGKRGNVRLITIIVTTYIATIAGIWFGFTLSIYFLISEYTYFEIVPLILRMIGLYPDFRTSFVLFACLTLVFTTIALLLKFATSKEAKESEIATFDKLD